MTDNRMPLHLFELLLPAVESGILPINRLTQWADNQIAKMAEPPCWLLDLATVKDSQEVRKAMNSILPPDYDPEPGYHGNIYLGCLYLAHLMGTISLSELLSRSGVYADGNSDHGVPECVEFYVLLNELEGAGFIITSNLPLKERVALLFQPMVETLRRSFGVDESTPVEAVLPELS